MWLERSVTNPEMDGFHIGRDSISNVPFSLSVSRQKTVTAKEDGMNIVQKIVLYIASNFALLKQILRASHVEVKFISVSLFPLA